MDLTKLSNDELMKLMDGINDEFTLRLKKIQKTHNCSAWEALNQFNELKIHHTQEPNRDIITFGVKRD